jgi:hypothetical protein
MNTSLRPEAQTSQGLALHRPQKHIVSPMTQRDDIDANDQLAMIEAAYAHHGGVLRADEAVLWMRSDWDQPISVLTKWIVSRAMITIDWRSEILIPMFQIDSQARGLRLGCREIISELNDVMGDWEIARWFATCDPWLGGLAPVDMLAVSWQKVLDAARVARFIARG